MKALIKVCTAQKEFNQDQIAIMKRISLVLIEHNLSVSVTYKVKKIKQLKLKAV
jgi:hypothetical protein